MGHQCPSWESQQWATSVLAGSHQRKAPFDLTLKQRNLGSIFTKHLELTADSCRRMHCVMVISFVRLQDFTIDETKLLRMTEIHISIQELFA